MLEVHPRYGPGRRGSTTRGTRDIERKRLRQIRVRSGTPLGRYLHASARRASKKAWSPVEFRPRHESDAELQQNFAVAKIHETNTDRKLGVVAIRDLPKGHTIIHEAPLFSCYHWASGRRTAVAEWSELHRGHREHMRMLFPKLKKVTDAGNDALKKRDKARLERFISDYAFSDPQRDRAHIYGLPCYINHACSSCANAEVWVDSEWPNYITVRLVQDIKKDDELFICYHKPNLYFGCAVCRHGQTLKGRLLSFIRNFGKRKRKANANVVEPLSDDTETSAARDSSALNATPSSDAGPSGASGSHASNCNPFDDLEPSATPNFHAFNDTHSDKTLVDS